MNKLWIIVLSFIWCINTAHTQNLRVQIIPSSPVKDETFTIRFTIDSNYKERPEITFDPWRITILGRSNERISMQTNIVNGRMSTSRKLEYDYEAQASHVGLAEIKNIKVKIGKRELTHKNIKIDIVNQHARPRKVFLEAQISKDKVFLGEGIDVKYYLYTQVPILGAEVREFPKFNNMIKRFHHVEESGETVNYRGAIYKRILKYSVRVYPNKTGKVKIGALKMRIQYSRRGDRFSIMGFGRSSTTLVRNQRIAIEVMPLPTENLPSNFTGLVGPHTFTLSQAKSKFLVNEAIEVRLEISGSGALENMDGPVLYNDSKLEKFDTRNELIETDKSNAKKVFDYTYLARAQLDISPYVVKLSYFDPDNRQYKEVSLQLPGIVASGTGHSGQSIPLVEKRDSIAEEQGNSIDAKKTERNKPALFSPLFEMGHYDTMQANRNKWLTILLLVIIVIQFVEWAVHSNIIGRPRPTPAMAIYRDLLKKDGVTYSRLHSLMSMMQSSETDLICLVEQSKLKDASKKYFIDLIRSVEGKAFGNRQKGDNISIDKGHFKDLLSILHNESRKRSKRDT